MENIKMIRKRHNKEIKILQSLCKHKKSTLGIYTLSPGVLGGEEKVCDFCGKILQRKSISMGLRM